MEKSSLADQVAQELRTAIMDGSFSLGEPLSEYILSDAFEVSRTPVRQALRQLQSEGLVEIVPQSGTYIFQPTTDEVFELESFRLHLELWASRLAGEVDRSAATDELRELLATMTAALTDDDRRLYNRLDARFHFVFFRHCGNRHLRRAYQMNAAQISALRAHLDSYTAGATATSMAEHALIVERFAAGDDAGVAEVLTDHITRSRESYAQMLRLREKHRAGDKRAEVLQKLGRA